MLFRHKIIVNQTHCLLITVDVQGSMSPGELLMITIGKRVIFTVILFLSKIAEIESAAFYFHCIDFDYFINSDQVKK